MLRPLAPDLLEHARPKVFLVRREGRRIRSETEKVFESTANRGRFVGVDEELRALSGVKDDGISAHHA